jgi:hypothetical protein
LRTGVPLGAVKSKTARAFKSLRRGLAPEDAAWEKGRGAASRSKNLNNSYNRASHEKQPARRSFYDITSISGY